MFTDANYQNKSSKPMLLVQILNTKINIGHNLFYKSQENWDITNV